MTLGSFIRQNLATPALPDPDGACACNEIVLVDALKHSIPAKQVEEAASNLYKFISSETFSEQVDKTVGDPIDGESEDQYVQRAKAQIDKVLMKQFER